MSDEKEAPAPATRPPLIVAPVYVDGAPVPAGVASAAKKAAPPVLGAVSIAILGAVAGYFVPRLLDRYAGSMLDPDHGEPVEVEFDEGE